MQPTSITLDDLDRRGADGVRWSLPRGGDLDGNVVRLGPAGRVAAHVNDEVDVLLIVLEGAGHATIDARSFELRAGVVVAIPKSTTREIRAADDAELVYVTVHRARPGVRIRA